MRARDLAAQRGDRGLAGRALQPVLAAKAKAEADIGQLQQVGVAVRIGDQILDMAEEPGAGIHLARQRGDKRLARPVAVAAPRRVERDVVDQRGHEPGALIGARQRLAQRHGGIARVDQRCPARAGASTSGWPGGCGALQFGREFQQGRKGGDQRIGMRTLAARARIGARGGTEDGLAPTPPKAGCRGWRRRTLGRPPAGGRWRQGTAAAPHPPPGGCGCAPRRETGRRGRPCHSSPSPAAVFMTLTC